MQLITINNANPVFQGQDLDNLLGMFEQSMMAAIFSQAVVFKSLNEIEHSKIWADEKNYSDTLLTTFRNLGEDEPWLIKDFPEWISILYPKCSLIEYYKYASIIGEIPMDTAKRLMYDALAALNRSPHRERIKQYITEINNYNDKYITSVHISTISRKLKLEEPPKSTKEVVASIVSTNGKKSKNYVVANNNPVVQERDIAEEEDIDGTSIIPYNKSEERKSVSEILKPSEDEKLAADAVKYRKQNKRLRKELKTLEAKMELEIEKRENTISKLKNKLKRADADYAELMEKNKELKVELSYYTRNKR